MQKVIVFIEHFHEMIWSWPLLAFFVVVGLVASIKTDFVQFRAFFYSLKLVFYPKKSAVLKGDISSFQSAMTILAGTIGVGCISGIAFAIRFSGPGCIFWMWVICLITMPLKFCEAFLANEFRMVNEKKQTVGGPMYYIKRGLNAPGLALFFTVFMILASFGMGNIMQVSAVTQSCKSLFNIKPIITALILMPIVFLIAQGGIKRIAKVLSVIVPVMMIVYVFALLAVIFKHIDQIPFAFYQIIRSAFNLSAIAGGSAIALMMKAIQMGAAQALFTSESGLGSSSIAACTSKDTSGYDQGLVSMACAFITSCLVCTLTAIAYISSGAFTPSLNLMGVDIAIYAFNTIAPWFGYLVFITIIPFAFSTMLSWIYYGQKGVEFIFTNRAVTNYAFFYVLVIFVSVFLNIDQVYLISNICNALMSIPNLIGLLLLAPYVKKTMVDANYN